MREEEETVIAEKSEWKKSKENIQFFGKLSETFRFLYLKRSSEEIYGDMRGIWKRRRTDVVVEVQKEEIEVYKEIKENEGDKMNEKNKIRTSSKIKRMSCKMRIGV